MSRKKPASPSSSAAKSRAEKRSRRDDSNDTALEPARPLVSEGAVREIVESVVIAFVLAFLFRTFEAEAFVIPTGSMAPTLMGRHKDLTCPQCGYPFQVSASDEVDSRSGRANGNEVIGCTCPMCRYQLRLDRGGPKGETYPSYKGDRILVGKFPYEFKDPSRWDVAVFKYPGEAQTNFIKRMVGLPRESIRLKYGDVFVRHDGDDHYTIARKPPRKLLAMLQPVYDNDYRLPKLDKLGWPPRWAPAAVTEPGTGGQWEPLDEGRAFSTDGSADETVWLHYRHIVPSYDDWQRFLADVPASERPKAQLISDFLAYNTDILGFPYQSDIAPDAKKLGLHWVGDLAIELEVEVLSDSGEVFVELVEGGRIFQCRFDVATGEATLGIDGLDDFHPAAQTKLRGKGSHRVRFSNVDDELLLWIDGSVVEFDSPTTYEPLGNIRPDASDLRPARIGSLGAAVKVSYLRLFRDIYYIAQELYHGRFNGDSITDFDPNHFPYSYPLSRHRVARFLSSPEEWDAFEFRRGVEFQLDADQFLVLGDNSAESKDSRLWGEEYYVKRELLIGKAFFIYWPHSFNRIPGTQVPMPFFPNFPRMGFVR